LSSGSSALGPSSLCLQFSELTCSEHAFVEGLSSILALGYRVSPKFSPHFLAIMGDEEDRIEMSEEIAFVSPWLSIILQFKVKDRRSRANLLLVVNSLALDTPKCESFKL